MVLLAAAVCAKAGKAIISRQFVEMSKARIEGLLAAFPKLLSSGKQHTFVETESVRYVYQPLDKLYMLLITTKASNILEDLETLRLFSRVIMEYCKAVEESEIVENAFNLIFAFDEIVALGYRESVNLAQIRTFVEMDSHEEKVYQAVRQTQEREAKAKMREKAKELQRARQEAAKKGLKSPGFGPSGFGSGSGSGGYSSSSPVSDTSPTEPIKSSYTAPSKPSATGKAMKLRTGHKDVDSFVDQLKQEGVQVINDADSSKSSMQSMGKTSTPIQNMESVHLRLEEKLTLTARRDGGVQDMELHGIISLRITDEAFGRIKIQIENNDDKGIQIQTHPNIDRELFRSQQTVALKNQSKPFPFNSDVGVLKWRFQTSDSAFMPLAINCWPSESGSNKCDVNIEYELQIDRMELHDVVITIPLVSGSGSPVVGDCDGEYHYDSRKNILEWQIPVIDSSNKTGSMEFSCNGRPNDFFPVTLYFVSNKPYSDLQILGLSAIDDGAPVKYSSETVLRVEKYEVV